MICVVCYSLFVRCWSLVGVCWLLSCGLMCGVNCLFVGVVRSDAHCLWFIVCWTVFYVRGVLVVVGRCCCLVFVDSWLLCVDI